MDSRHKAGNKIREAGENGRRAFAGAKWVRRGVTYAQFVEKLAAIGIGENEHNLRNEMSRGKFTARFLRQFLTALGVQSLRLEE